MGYCLTGNLTSRVVNPVIFTMLSDTVTGYGLTLISAGIGYSRLQLIFYREDAGYAVYITAAFSQNPLFGGMLWTAIFRDIGEAPGYTKPDVAGGMNRPSTAIHLHMHARDAIGQ